MDVTFKLTSQDLANYRYAVRNSMERTPSRGFWSQEWLRFAIFFIAFLGIYFLLEAVVPAVTGKELSPISLGLGFALGLLVCATAMWLHSYDQSRKFVRPDGHTLSERRISATSEGVTIRSPSSSAHFDWSSIENVTVERGLVILWIEPSAGLAVPDHAFADKHAREAFIATIAAHRS